MTTPKPLGTIYYIHEYETNGVRPGDKIYKWEDVRLPFSRRYREPGVYIMQAFRAIDSICRGPNKQVDLRKSPLSKELFEHLRSLSSYEKLEAIWQGNSGTAASDVREIGTRRLHLQTPNDGRLFFSFHMEHDEDDPVAFTCILISSNPILDSSADCTTLVDRLIQSAPGWRHTSVAFVIIPNILAHIHVQDTELRRSSLGQRLEDIETVIATGVEADLGELVRSLHDCNLELIKLRGRRKFEKKFLESMSSYTTAAFHDFNPRDAIEEEQCRRIFGDVWDIENEPYYDLDELTTRITNSFTAVYNLVAQRDMRASVTLATASQQIAEEALRDSTAMRTIAVMTLIFLPATFLCSFFSMTLFNWSPPEGEPITKYLWIYFASLIPLTVVVVVAWLWFTRTTRERLQQWLGRKRRRKQREKEKV